LFIILCSAFFDIFLKRLKNLMKIQLTIT